MGHATEITFINTDPGTGSWASSPSVMSEGEYIDWVENERGQNLLVLERRLKNGIISMSELRLKGLYSSVILEYMLEKK